MIILIADEFKINPEIILKWEIPKFLTISEGLARVREEQRRIIEKEERKREFFRRMGVR